MGGYSRVKLEPIRTKICSEGAELCFSHFCIVCAACKPPRGTREKQTDDRVFLV